MRKDEPFIRASYYYGPIGHWIELRRDVWISPWVSGIAWKGDAGRIPSETPEVDEDRGRCLARYLLLMRPWEEKDGVVIRRRCRTVHGDHELPPRID